MTICYTTSALVLCLICNREHGKTWFSNCIFQMLCEEAQLWGCCPYLPWNEGNTEIWFFGCRYAPDVCPVKVENTKKCSVAEKELSGVFRNVGSEGCVEVSLTDKSSQQDGHDIWLSVTSVVLPVDVNNGRVNKEYPMHTLQEPGRRVHGRKLISNLDLASERVSLKGEPKVNFAFESAICMGNVHPVGKIYNGLVLCWKVRGSPGMIGKHVMELAEAV